MKKYSILLLLFVMSWSYAQEINQYQFALVPSKFGFLREADQYQLNSLTLFLMKKEGFDAYLDTNNEMPEEMMRSNCSKIFVDVISSGNFLATKLTVVLKDCKGKVLFTSKEGKSKLKDFKKGYHEALRFAFESFNTLHYVYTPLKTGDNPVTVVAVKETPVKENVAVAPVVVAPVVTAAVVTTNEVKPVATETTINEGELLFAQPITNGYQLIDSTPKVVMKIYNTSGKNTYTAVKGSTQGVFILKDNQWFFEYYQDDKLISEKINVKF